VSITPLRLVAFFARFLWGMIEPGVYLPCSQFEAAFLSAAHTDRHVAQTVAAACETLAECRAQPVPRRACFARDSKYNDFRSWQQVLRTDEKELKNDVT
jgi:hypothetical protein